MVLESELESELFLESVLAVLVSVPASLGMACSAGADDDEEEKSEMDSISLDNELLVGLDLLSLESSDCLSDI